MAERPLSSIAERVAAVRAEMLRACERARRDPASVALVGVTKGHPLEVVDEAIGAGLSEFGENRAQELLPKAQAAARRGLLPRWHFVGHLQRNKVRDVLPHIVALHSLDSTRLMEEIEREQQRRRAADPLPCYLEVNIAGEPGKEGVPLEELPALLTSADAFHSIEVVGLMTVAPQVPDPEQVRPVFRRMHALATTHGLRGLSMGMSDDYLVAIEEGATVVRVGRALFGAGGT
jgi:pyridoxal phosphate enzyme (YggS family)